MRVAVFLAALSFPLVAAAVDTAGFERMQMSQWADVLHDSRVAYDAKRYDEAFGLFQRAACAGDKESQSAVGRMYLLGQGTARDDLTGYAWLSVAAESHFGNFQTIVHTLRDAMTPEQRTLADARAQRMGALYGLAATGMSCTARASRGGHIIDQLLCMPQREGALVVLHRCEQPVPAAH